LFACLLFGDDDDDDDDDDLAVDLAIDRLIVGRLTRMIVIVIDR